MNDFSWRAYVEWYEEDGRVWYSLMADGTELDRFPNLDEAEAEADYLNENQDELRANLYYAKEMLGWYAPNHRSTEPPANRRVVR